MPAYIVFIRAATLDDLRKGVVAAWLKEARAWDESPPQQDAAQGQSDSWLADMEYCDRF